MMTLKGSLQVPGDKSISHRALILGALAKGKTMVSNLLKSEDVDSTRHCLELLGIKIENVGNKIEIVSQGLHSLKASSRELNCGNSGTTMRLLMGLLAAQNFDSVLIGDNSLSKRPMSRVAKPLRKMGACIELRDSNYAPISMSPGQLHATDCELEVASAQVKSAIMLAALFCEKATHIAGLIQSRDHSERMFKLFGAHIKTSDALISVAGGQDLEPCSVEVPGDPSTAAFWMAAACIVPNSDLEIRNISLNPTRTGFLEALQKMGAKIQIEPLEKGPEPTGHVRVCFSKLQAIQIHPEEVPSLIDEIPVLAVVCTQAEGLSEIRGAGELRVKESDRLEAIAQNLRKMGVQIKLLEDGFQIHGPQKLTGASINSYDDHRIAMAFSIAGLIAEGVTQVSNPDCVSISYPGFFDALKELSV